MPIRARRARILALCLSFPTSTRSSGRPPHSSGCGRNRRHCRQARRQHLPDRSQRAGSATGALAKSAGTADIGRTARERSAIDGIESDLRRSQRRGCNRRRCKSVSSFSGPCGACHQDLGLGPERLHNISTLEWLDWRPALDRVHGWRDDDGTGIGRIHDLTPCNQGGHRHHNNREGFLAWAKYARCGIVRHVSLAFE